MNTEEQYRQEWAVKSGRPASEVYVPEAIREVDVERENELREALGLPPHAATTVPLEELRKALGE